MAPCPPPGTRGSARRPCWPPTTRRGAGRQSPTTSRSRHYSRDWCGSRQVLSAASSRTRSRTCRARRRRRAGCRGRGSPARRPHGREADRRARGCVAGSRTAGEVATCFSTTFSKTGLSARGLAPYSTLGIVGLMRRCVNVRLFLDGIGWRGCRHSLHDELLVTPVT